MIFQYTRDPSDTFSPHIIINSQKYQHHTKLNADLSTKAINHTMLLLTETPSKVGFWLSNSGNFVKIKDK